MSHMSNSQCLDQNRSPRHSAEADSSASLWTVFHPVSQPHENRETFGLDAILPTNDCESVLVLDAKLTVCHFSLLSGWLSTCLEGHFLMMWRNRNKEYEICVVETI